MAFRKRQAAGRAELGCPSRETVRRAIRELDPLRCDLARDGVEATRRKRAPVGRGLDLTRLLERVELDTWKVDLMSLMAESGLLHFLSEEDRATLGLDRKTARWHLAVAQCATTRCILAMKLCRAPNAQTTLQLIDMLLRDKGVWCDAVGALSPWDTYGTPEELVTDCGAEYMAFDVRVALRDLGIRLEQAPAGLPDMRGRIERLFKTMSAKLMPRLTGRTFGSMLEKGDSDPAARAALTADDLCAALIRWVVDIHHNTPHTGLDGETPAQCWTRLTEQYGVCPPPDMRRRRLGLGTRMERTVQETGVTVFGVRYHCETLARWALHSRDRRVNLRWYAEDIGAIVVDLGGEWIKVPAVFERFNGFRAQTWLAAARELRAQSKYQASFTEDAVFDAIRHIEAINGQAMRRIGLVSDDWSQDRVLREEERLFLGFDCQASEPGAHAHAADSAWGEALPTAATGPRDAANDAARAADTPTPPSPDPDTVDPGAGATIHGRDDEDDGSEWDIEDKA